MFPVSFCSASLLHRDSHCPTITEPSSKVQRRHSQVPVSVIDGDMKPVTDDLGHWVSNRYIRWFIWYPLWSLWFGFVYPFCMTGCWLACHRMNPQPMVPSVEGHVEVWALCCHKGHVAWDNRTSQKDNRTQVFSGSWFSCLRLPSNLA